MKIFMDMEFTGLHQKTSLISIGLVSDDDKTFYAEFTDYDKSQMNEWLEENVIENTIALSGTSDVRLFPKTINNNVMIVGKTSLIVHELKDWLEQFEEIEIWGDCLAYDWVLFCELFGGALNIPRNIYYIPFDICTLMNEKRVDPDINRERFAGVDSVKHNALDDALTIKKCYWRLQNISMETTQIHFLDDEEIDIFVNSDGIGYGFVYHNGAYFISDLYKNRVDLDDIIFEGEFENSCQDNPMHYNETHTLLDGVNAFMDFWRAENVDFSREVYIVTDYSVVPSLLDESSDNIVLIIKRGN